MSERIIYLNGDYLAESAANLSVLDRGLLFADAVYEGLHKQHRQITDRDQERINLLHFQQDNHHSNK